MRQQVSPLGWVNIFLVFCAVMGYVGLGGVFAVFQILGLYALFLLPFTLLAWIITGGSGSKSSQNVTKDSAFYGKKFLSIFVVCLVVIVVAVWLYGISHMSPGWF